MLGSYWTFFSLLATIAIWFYFRLKKRYSYWSDRGVPGPKPLPFVGNMHTRMAESLYTLETEWAAKYGKVYGAYFAMEPVLFVTDPDLIKQVLVKDFANFVNRANLPTTHEYINQTLLFAQDEQWRRIRTITSPAFTSGKLRAMHQVMMRCVRKLEVYLDRLVHDKQGEMDTREVIRGFTIDVIASTSFATETNANDDRANQQQNPLIINAKKMFDIKGLKIIAMLLLPKFMLDLLGLDTFFSTEPLNYFVDLTKQIVKNRHDVKQQQQGSGNDLVQLMIDASVDEAELESGGYDKLAATDDQDEVIEQKSTVAKSAKRKTLTDSEIIANCIIFFVAGFETTSATISHCIFELVHNPDVQERLYNELQQALSGIDDSTGSDEYFDTIINRVPYLEAVIKETLRIYPPLMLMTRMCNKDGYQLGDVVLERDRLVAIPINALHHNPDYFPDPMRFKPDRFLPENKHLIVPYSYLAFAAGPRNCAGMRFAYQEVKLCLARVVRRYRFEPSPTTPEKLTFVKGSSLLVSAPFNVRVCTR